MPRNGSGVYALPQAAFVPNTTISSAAVNSDFSDIATALTGSVSADGQTPMTGPFDLNGTRLRGDAVVAKSANFTMVDDDSGTTFNCSGAIVPTLPDAAVVGNGWNATLNNTGTNTLTLTPTGGQSIDGSTSAKLIYSKQQVKILCDGSNFFLIWIDKNPVVGSWTYASPVSSVTLVLPDGYAYFGIEGQGISVTTSGSSFLMRESVNSGVSFLSGATDYTRANIFALTTGGSPGNDAGSTSAHILAGGSPTGASVRSSLSAKFTPGAASLAPTLSYAGMYADNTTGAIVNYNYRGFSQNVARVNMLQFFVFGGNIQSGSIIILGFAP